MSKRIQKIMFGTLVKIMLSTALATQVHAQSNETQQKAEQSKLDELKALYPNTTINSVRPSHIKGVYEVVMGRNIAYTDDSGRYFLFGHLFDMQKQIDLTADRYTESNQVEKAQREFPKAYLNNAIKTVKGNGQRVLALFSDPDCPYCKKIESELDRLDNITIYTFLYPLESLHPEAKQKAISVWCASDRLSAWQTWMKADKLPPEQNCQHPLDANLALGKKLHISGTPTLIAEDGRVLVGAASIEKIEAWLNQEKGRTSN